jgi:methylated-DNA-[protein]-cysteine S-methyltransferase
MKDTFAQKVYAVVKKIPRGSVMTYAGVAKKAGKPGAARAVGTLMAHNANKSIPCHRVIRSDGKIGEYNGLQGKSKKELLRAEGAIA